MGIGKGEFLLSGGWMRGLPADRFCVWNVWEDVSEEKAFQKHSLSQDEEDNV